MWSNYYFVTATGLNFMFINMDEALPVFDKIKQILEERGYISMAQACILADCRYVEDDFKRGWNHPVDLQIRNVYRTDDPDPINAAISFPEFHYYREEVGL